MMENQLEKDRERHRNSYLGLGGFSDGGRGALRGLPGYIGRMRRLFGSPEGLDKVCGFGSGIDVF